jgi:hypothetical protein
VEYQHIPVLLTYDKTVHETELKSAAFNASTMTPFFVVLQGPVVQLVVKFQQMVKHYNIWLKFNQSMQCVVQLMV